MRSSLLAEDDLEKARQMREEGEVDATAADAWAESGGGHDLGMLYAEWVSMCPKKVEAAALKAIPDVIIDDGTFKYVCLAWLI